MLCTSELTKYSISLSKCDQDAVGFGVGKRSLVEITSPKIYLLSSNHRLPL